jgi:enoyl-CoA hydratase/carnithine racemase
MQRFTDAHRQGREQDMSDVLVAREGRTLRVTLNRPAVRNALTQNVVREVTAALEAAATDADVRVVVLTGAGGYFCAGADLRKTFEEDPDFLDHLDAYMAEYHALVRSIFRCPKPTVAAIDGAAVGFGADIAFACDLRVVSETAYVEERFVKIGLMPDGGGTFWLPRVLGTSRAMQMILLAERLDASAMKALGLAASVAPPGQLDASVRALADRLTAGPPLAFAEIKSALYASWGDLEAALTRERQGQLRLMQSKDAMEGITAFFQKRAPEFAGA